MRDHLAAGRHCPGILTLSASMTLAETIEEMALIWSAADAEEFADQIVYLPVRV